MVQQINLNFNRHRKNDNINRNSFANIHEYKGQQNRDCDTEQ